MATSVETKVRVGFSLAMVMSLAMAGSVAFTQFKPLQARDGVVCAAIAGASLLMWLVGVLVTKHGGTAKVKANGPQATAEHPLACFKRPRHLGLILMAAAVLAYAFTTYNRQHKLKVVLPSRAVPKPTAISFPPLKLQGLIMDGIHSSALINGEVLRAGEGIGKVLVVEINSDHVAVELEGQKKVLSLPQ